MTLAERKAKYEELLRGTNYKFDVETYKKTGESAIVWQIPVVTTGTTSEYFSVSIVWVETHKGGWFYATVLVDYNKRVNTAKKVQQTDVCCVAKVKDFVIKRTIQCLCDCAHQVDLAFVANILKESNSQYYTVFKKVYNV